MTDSRQGPGQGSGLTSEYLRHFWSRAREGHLDVQVCKACSLPFFYPRPFCKMCLSAELTWTTLDRPGRIYSHSTVYRAPASDFEYELPYVVGLIEWQGLRGRVLGRILGAPEADDICEAAVEFLPSTPRAGFQFHLVPAHLAGGAQS